MASIVTLAPTWDEAYNQFARKYWTDLMQACGANVCKMARVAHCHRGHVYACLKRFKVTLPGGSCYSHRGTWGNLSNEEPIKSIA